MRHRGWIWLDGDGNIENYWWCQAIKSTKVMRWLLVAVTYSVCVEGTTVTADQADNVGSEHDGISGSVTAR